MIPKEEIQNYIYNTIIFKWNKVVKLEKDMIIRQYIWVTLTLLFPILLYIGKYIIDIKNLNSSMYIFGNKTIIIYFIISLMFLILNFIKSRILCINVWIDFVIAIMFLIGVSLFVFGQTGQIRVQILVISVYLCSIYVSNTFEVINILNSSYKKVAGKH